MEHSEHYQLFTLRCLTSNHYVLGQLEHGIIHFSSNRNVACSSVLSANISFFICFILKLEVPINSWTVTHCVYAARLWSVIRSVVLDICLLQPCGSPEENTDTVVLSLMGARRHRKQRQAQVNDQRGDIKVHAGSMCMCVCQRVS